MLHCKLYRYTALVMYFKIVHFFIYQLNYELFILFCFIKSRTLKYFHSIACRKVLFYDSYLKIRPNFLQRLDLFLSELFFLYCQPAARCERYSMETTMCGFEVDPLLPIKIRAKYGSDPAFSTKSIWWQCDTRCVYHPEHCPKRTKSWLQLYHLLNR